MKKEKAETYSPARVAERWNIPHIASVDNHEAWKMSFMALGTATVHLDRANDRLTLLEDSMELMIEDCNKYLAALHMICQKYDLDIEDVIEEASLFKHQN
tara:strand:+ start:1413 stop:1712 length:300 start_codon:yes stop_codon:yes gene_type:complete